MTGRLQNRAQRVERDWRLQILWGGMKLAFGVIVAVGVQDINARLERIDSSIVAQKLDHQHLQSLQKQADQTIATQEAHTRDIQTNTDAIQVNTNAIQSLSKERDHSRK